VDEFAVINSEMFGEPKMPKEWNEAELQRYIKDEVEENLTLDYKAAAALDRNNSKTTEITKDVSAMANAAGGTIIYGLKEFPRPKNHLAERIDPIDRTRFSKEWLEQIINNIRPRINALMIYPINVSTGPNDVAYVVEVPLSNTAHQAVDHKYYKRFNFESVPMADHEVRDVMNRATTIPAFEALVDELEFNAEVAKNCSGDMVGCHFHEEQFRRAIQLGVISTVREELKQSINQAYVSIGKANHILQTWTSSANYAARVNMQQEVMSTVSATSPKIAAAQAELMKFLGRAVV
jgi:hypothetical protein